MWELAGQLLPEMLGLVVTPAAIIACLILLGSRHALRNVVVLAGIFLVVYAAISVIVVSIGQAVSASTSQPTTARGWISLIVGLLFLLGGAWSLIRGMRTPAPRLAAAADRRAAVKADTPPRGTPADDHDSEAILPVGAADVVTAAVTADLGPLTTPPQAPRGWVQRLADPSLKLVLAVGLLLAVLNPNIAILASGLGIILTADVSHGQQFFAVILLLAACMLDFVVPGIAFGVAGPRGRQRLRNATQWLIEHNHAIGIVVLFGFGMMFVGRALGQLLS